MVFAFVGQRSKTRSATRAQEVVLASATFDEEGRILVTPDGLLPCRKITDSYLERVSFPMHEKTFTADVLGHRRSMIRSTWAILYSVGFLGSLTAGQPY